ncbi:hypothetical protein MAJ_03484, partial [Metarhizium majus ARSEF 297]
MYTATLGGRKAVRTSSKHISLASANMQKLKTVDSRIQTELMQETDGLIQHVTNLISIDEGYRSRDENESIGTREIDMDHGQYSLGLAQVPP